MATPLRIPLLFCFLLLCLLPAPAKAKEGEAAFRQAHSNYKKLLDDSRRQLYRDNWQQVIDQLRAIPRQYPKHTRAPAALYWAGRAAEGLFSVSKRPADARQAMEIYDLLAGSYPASTLADDALLLAAGIQEEVFKDRAEAYRRYQLVVDQYRSGDMLGKARRKAAELKVFAPAPAPQKSPAPPPVKVAPAPTPAGSQIAEVTAIRFWSNPGYTRVVLDLSGPVDFKANFLAGDPGSGATPRLYVDIDGANPGSGVQETTTVHDGLLRQIRAGRPELNKVRVVLDLQSFGEYKVFPLTDPYRIVLDVAGSAEPVIAAVAPTEITAAPPAAQRPAAPPQVVRPVEQPLPARPPAVTTGLRRVVVDAGHGGKDPGAIGPSGVYEKDVTLAMARLLAHQLRKELGCEVILTRDRDVYLDLAERTAIANKVGADLFISIHVNAAPNKEAHGIETYYLNFSKNEQAAAVAARENGTSLKQVGDLELILFDLMANSKINESSRLAAEIQRALVGDLSRHYGQIRDLGVRQGPFYVLLGANMPSVLVEAGFISHKREETRLTDSRFHERTAAAIVKAVRNYANSPQVVAANQP
jgi:N-acetylmuramoyl-L-alanine amidase